MRATIHTILTMSLITALTVAQSVQAAEPLPTYEELVATPTEPSIAQPIVAPLPAQYAEHRHSGSHCTYAGCTHDSNRDWFSNENRGLWNEERSTWYDNLTIFVGLEGAKQPQEFGVNAHFGGRASVNWSSQLFDESNIGIQIGTAINYTDNAVQVLELIGEAKGRSQSYTTIGLFERTDCGLLWGVTWDHLHQSYYDKFDIDQFRARLGYMTDDVNEFGIRASIAASRDFGSVRNLGGDRVNVELESIAQGTAYWRHFWKTGADTMMWAGVAESHSEKNLVTGGGTASGAQLVFGAEINIPLNDHFALFGQGNFISPADTGTVDSFLGVAFYPGGTAMHARKHRYSSLHPVANSTNFAVDLR